MEKPITQNENVKTSIEESITFKNSFGHYMKEFVNSYAEERRLSAETRNNYFKSLKKFCERTYSDKIYRLEDITSEYLLAYADTLQSKGNMVTILRAVLSDLYSKKIINYRTASTFVKYKTRPERKLPTFYKPEEVIEIEKAVVRKYPVGKRDYAMILLATRLGLRSSDIRLLKFSNLDWDRSLIYLTQYKTKVPLELPLLGDVGEALIDYLKHARPKSSHKNIFLTGVSPYKPLTSTSTNTIFKKYFIKAKVKFDNKRHGPHSLRHSLATNLIKNGVTLSTVSEILGHSNTSTTMIYLHLDTQELLKCSLNVPTISEKFYNQ